MDKQWMVCKKCMTYEYDTAKQSLISKGLLNKRGAITDKGRNVLASYKEE